MQSPDQQGTTGHRSGDGEVLMKPVSFRYANKTLQPSSCEYSENVEGVDPLPIWTDGEQCVSRWRLTLLERLAVLVFGHVWVSVLSGRTQPPICVSADREYVRECDA